MPILTVSLESTDLTTDGIVMADIEIYKLRGVEKINQPFEYRVRLVYKQTTPIPSETLLGAGVSLVFKRDAVEKRRVHGMVRAARDHMDADKSYIVYDLVIVPRLWDLSRVEQLDVYLGKTVKEILEDKLQAIQLSTGTDYSLGGVTGSYPAREFVLQYRETDLSFVQRLAEHVGICSYFDHSGSVDKVVFLDTGSFPDISEPAGELPFLASGLKTDVYRLRTVHRAVSHKVICKDYNYRTPSDIVSNDAAPDVIIDSAGAGTVIDYGSHPLDATEATALATVRAQERGAVREVYHGVADFQSIQAGVCFTLTSHPRNPPKLLVVEAHYRASQAATGMATPTNPGFEVRFSAIAASRRYRPPRVTPKPRIRGVLSAVVQQDSLTAGPGAIAASPALDAQGRYLIKFKFDDRLQTDGVTQRNGSHRVRMAHALAGHYYGWHFPLRKGVEVMVAFEDGDPDRPVIVGAIHHPLSKSPVVDVSQSKNRLKTESGVLLEIEDGAGS